MICLEGQTSLHLDYAYLHWLYYSAKSLDQDSKFLLYFLALVPMSTLKSWMHKIWDDTVPPWTTLPTQKTPNCWTHYCWKTSTFQYSWCSSMTFRTQRRWCALSMIIHPASLARMWTLRISTSRILPVSQMAPCPGIDHMYSSRILLSAHSKPARKWPSI